MKRLSNATLAEVSARVARPAYDRSKLQPSVVHLGPGAFHRAHQAPVFDALNARAPHWGITGVSLHSREVRAALAPQDGLYTLALLDEHVSYRVIGAVRDVLVAPENPEAVLQRLSAPETEIVTLTITEKGYWQTADGEFDVDNAEFHADRANPQNPRSAIGYLAEALRRRRRSGLKPFALLSCDNVSQNGHRLAATIWTLASEQGEGPDFLDWLVGELASPPTMVDSITPATDDALRARIEAELGVQDAWPIQREAFTQWVIGADPRFPQLDWAAAGVTVAADVGGFERAKLRVLNASHSALAYLGLLRGHDTVAEAMADAELAAFVRALMDDIGDKLNTEIDVAPYKQAVLQRFRNPAIRHLLAQIAWDGSQKLPNRLLPYIQEAAAFGWPLGNAARAVAAWFQFLRLRVRTGETLVDPLAPLLLATAARASGEAAHDVALFLELDAVFPAQLAGSELFRAALVDAYAQLGR